MRRLLSILFVAALCCATTGAMTLDKSLRYTARYHFGIIKINAGYADIAVKIDGHKLSGSFDGQSISWRGRIYCVNDTLEAIMTDNKECVLYENGWYTKPYKNQMADGTYERDKSINYKTINGQGSLDASNATMEAVTITADLLGLFYYLQAIDFDAMAAGDKYTVDISTADGRPGKLIINYIGRQDYDDTLCYNITFEYSYDGQMSHYPVTCLVSPQSRLPLLFSANIKIGHVELIAENN